MNDEELIKIISELFDKRVQEALNKEMELMILYGNPETNNEPQGIISNLDLS